MNCPHCSEALGERGNFCKACGGQAKCLQCREILEPGALACVECGTKVGAGPENLSCTSPFALTANVAAPRNTLTYHEDRNSRSFEASLTDPAMQGLGDVLGEFFVQRGTVRTAPQTARFNRQAEILAPQALLDATQLPRADEMSEAPPAVDETAAEKLKLRKIFLCKCQSFELSDNRLKADSARDYVRRLTYLFIYAHEVYGHPHPTEASVRAILQSAKSWDASGNANTWLKKRIGIAVENEDQLKLTAPGREGAIATLKDALDANIADSWNPDKSAPKQRNARKKKA